MKQPRASYKLATSNRLANISGNGLCKDQVAFMLSDLDMTFARYLSPVGKHQCTASLPLPGMKVVLTCSSTSSRFLNLDEATIWANSPDLPWVGIQFCSYGPRSAIAGDQEPVELCLVQVAITCPVLA